MDSKLTKVSWIERRWVLAFAIILMVITTLPYILGYARAGGDWEFTGFVFGVEDGNSYIAKMLSGASGNWLFFSPYTAYLQHGVIAFLPYILLGKLSSAPGQHEQLVVLFHLFRIFAGILAITATYDFLAIFLAKVKSRRLGVLLICLGGGFGWFLVLIGQEDLLGSLPLEFYSPESFGFLAIFGLPHLLLARAFLLWGFRFYLVGDDLRSEVRFDDKGRWFRKLLSSGVFTGIMFLAVGLAQPLTVVIGWVLLLAHSGGLFFWTLPKKNIYELEKNYKLRSYFKRVLLAIGVSSPIVIYTALTFSTDPFLVEWTAQNIILSPHPIQYLLAYGLLLPFAFGGSYFVLHDDPWRGWFPVVWVLLIPVLAYAPYNLQRRLPEGVWVAIVVLAVKAVEGPVQDGLTGCWSRLNLFYQRLAPVFVFLVFSSLILFAGGLRAAFTVQEPLFRTAVEVDALNFLNSHAQPGEIVLSAYESGNVIPSWAPVRVVVGHGPESVKLSKFIPIVSNFYDVKTSRLERLGIIAKLNIKYIYWGPKERELGDWKPEKGDGLLEIFSNDGYLIFEVQES